MGSVQMLNNNVNGFPLLQYQLKTLILIHYNNKLITTQRRLKNKIVHSVIIGY